MICLWILILNGIAYIFLLVPFIILLVDYFKLLSFLKEGGRELYDYILVINLDADMKEVLYLFLQLLV